MKFKSFILALFLVVPFIVEAQKDIKKECVPTVMFSVASASSASRLGSESAAAAKRTK